MTNDELLVVAGGDIDIVKPEEIENIKVDDMTSALNGTGLDYTIGNSYEVFGQTVTITGSGAEGFQTAISDCANGAEVGGLIGLFLPIATPLAALIGCAINTGVGVYRATHN